MSRGRWDTLRRGASASGRAAAATGRGTAKAGRGGYRRLRRATNSGGAGESGLGRVLELHLVSSAADALIVTALASTIFFSVPTGQARGRVALSLLVTMVPFAVLAPVLGPLLDRVRRGRRYALAGTMVLRAFVSWVMADAVAGGPTRTSLSLYPAAFGFLVCQKAYLVTRAAAVPRVLPHNVTLVRANSRINLAGVAAMAVGAPLGAGVTALLGPEWTLRLAFAVFAAGTALALTLSPVVDTAEGEVPARLVGSDPHEQPTVEVPVRSVGSRVSLALRGNAGARAFSGFLTLFLVFRLRSDPIGGLSATTTVALVVAVAAVGGGVGTALGGLLRRGVRPEAVVGLSLLATAGVAAWAALSYGLLTVLAASAVAGLAQSLAKLCLDSLIQGEVAETVRTSAFARSETVLQLAWVLGGVIGLVLPLSGAWGLGVAAVGCGAGSVAYLVAVLRARRAPGSESAGRNSYPRRAPDRAADSGR